MRKHAPTRPARALALAISAALAAGSLATGCGVPLQDRATYIPPDQVPYDLGATTAPPTTAPDAATHLATLYFVLDDELVAVQRPVSTPPVARTAVELLLQPLSDAEASLGLRRALSDPTLVDTVSSSGTSAQVELTDDFLLLPAREQLLALGQLVLTLTGLDEVARVRFTLDREPLSVPTASGSVADGAVARDDYLPLLA
ncbi:MAG: GerMN domain-containing protein [Acidimicrobiales bacterium]